MLEIKVKKITVSWELNGGQKAWALTASGTVVSSDFHVSFDVQKVTGRAPALKFHDGRLFQTNMTAEARQKMALEIKAHCEKHMNEQLMIILKSRPSL